MIKAKDQLKSLKIQTKVKVKWDIPENVSVFPDELEFVHVEQPTVGQPQMRNHRQRQEGKLLERFAEPQPSRCAASITFFSFGSMSAKGSAEISPPISSGSSASTLPFSTATKPPPHSIRALTATAISPSFAPTTQRLWLSWPTLEANAPLADAETVHKAQTGPRFAAVAGQHGQLQHIPAGVGVFDSVDQPQLHRQPAGQQDSLL